MDKERREITLIKNDVIDLYNEKVKIRISCDKTHIGVRMKQYNIGGIDNLVNITLQGVRQYLLDNIGKISKNFIHIIDKQSCICVPCNIDESKIEGPTFQSVLIKTVFKITGRGGAIPSGVIVYLNEDNPSEEWNDAMDGINKYRGKWTKGGSSSISNPRDFVAWNYNWKPDAKKDEVAGDPLTTKGYYKLGDVENKNVHRAFINRLLDYHSEQEKLNRQNSMKGQFNEYERNERVRKGWDKVKLAKSLYDADTQPIDGINQGLRDVDSIRKKQYDDVLSMVDNEPIPGLNQDLRDADNIKKGRNQNESIILTQNDLKYIIFETVKRIKAEKRLS